MKRVGLVFICVVLVSPLAAQTDRGDDWENPTAAKLGLQGPAKSLRVERAEAGGERYPLQQCTFDRKGRALECTDFDPQRRGEVRSRKIFYYHGRGTSAGSDSYDRYSGTERLKVTRFKFDTEGRRIEQWVTNPGKAPTRTFTYKYDPRGYLAEEVSYSPLYPQHPIGFTKYKYDDEGRVTDEEYEDNRDSALSWSKHHQYNPAGQIVKTRLIQFEDLGATAVFTYDEQGRKTSATTTAVNESFFHSCSDCSEGGRVTYAYDASGHVTEKITYDKRGQLTKAMHTSYVYDSHGNWTKADEVTVPKFALNEPRRPASTTFRTIGYY